MGDPTEAQQRILNAFSEAIEYESWENAKGWAQQYEHLRNGTVPPLPPVFIYRQGGQDVP